MSAPRLGAPAPAAAIGQRVVCAMAPHSGGRRLELFDGEIVALRGSRLVVRFDRGADTYSVPASDCVVTGRARR